VRPPHTPGTPPEPRESRSDNHSLRAPTEKIHDGLLKWWLQPAPSGSQSIRNRGVISETLSLAPIAWVETLVCSIRNNWRPGQKGLQLLRAQPSRRKNLWCFLDASRSTGANQFLSAARDVLPSLAQAVRSARFHLLILDQQGIRWLARRASAKHFASVISQIETAGGKSLIAPALRMLHRQRLRCGATSRDKVLICSDGLATPLPGIQSGQTWRVLRDHIQQITRTSAFIAWLHPSPKRGLSQWLGRICDDPRVMRFQVE